MIDDVTTRATLTSYSLTVMFYFKKIRKILRFYCREVESTRNSKLRQLSGNYLVSPGLSGRVESPAKCKYTLLHPSFMCPVFSQTVSE